MTLDADKHLGGGQRSVNGRRDEGFFTSVARRTCWSALPTLRHALVRSSGERRVGDATGLRYYLS